MSDNIYLVCIRPPNAKHDNYIPLDNKDHFVIQKREVTFIINIANVSFGWSQISHINILRNLKYFQIKPHACKHKLLSVLYTWHAETTTQSLNK